MGIGPKFLVRAETRDKTHLIEGCTLPVPPNASICSKSLKVSISIASPLESGDIPGELAKTCRPNDSPTAGHGGAAGHRKSSGMKRGARGDRAGPAQGPRESRSEARPRDPELSRIFCTI